MDHFNATVKDGKLVKTRRGLQVSRQRFNGLSFVNSSPREDPSSDVPRPSGATTAQSPSQLEIRFVDECGESGRENTGGQNALDSAQGPKPQLRRRAARLARGRSPVPSRIPTTSSRSSPVTASPSQESSDRLPQPNYPNPTTPTAAAATGGATLDSLSRLTSNDRTLFERRLADVPRCMYPHEDLLAYNPARGPDFTAMAVSDNAAVHCVLMCGSVVDAAASPRITEGSNDNAQGDGDEGHDDDDLLAHYVSKTCAMLSQKLDRDRDRPADAVTLHCIATLAWVGYYTGRIDHWQLHMSGLKKVLDLNGGALEGLPAWLLDELHRADLQGAVALASSPYLPLPPNLRWRGDSNCSSLSDVLPADVRERTADTVTAVLRPLGVHHDVVALMASLGVFATAVCLARRSGGAVVFDPHAFVAELHALTHALLSVPGPLRAAEGPNTWGTTSLYDASAVAEKTSSGSTRGGTAAVAIPGARSVSLEVGEGGGKVGAEENPGGEEGKREGGQEGRSLSPTLRIAALLYLKLLLPDFPRTPSGSYTLLLALLRRHLRHLLDANPYHSGSSARASITNPNLQCISLFLALVGASASRAARLSEHGDSGREGAAGSGIGVRPLSEPHPQPARGGERPEPGRVGTAAGTEPESDHPDAIYGEILRQIMSFPPREEDWLIDTRPTEVGVGLMESWGARGRSGLGPAREGDRGGDGDDNFDTELDHDNPGKAATTSVSDYCRLDDRASSSTSKPHPPQFDTTNTDTNVDTDMNNSSIATTTLVDVFDLSSVLGPVWADDDDGDGTKAFGGDAGRGQGVYRDRHIQTGFMDRDDNRDGIQGKGKGKAEEHQAGGQRMGGWDLRHVVRRIMSMAE